MTMEFHRNGNSLFHDDHENSIGNGYQLYIFKPNIPGYGMSRSVFNLFCFYSNSAHVSFSRKIVFRQGRFQTGPFSNRAVFMQTRSFSEKVVFREDRFQRGSFSEGVVFRGGRFQKGSFLEWVVFRGGRFQRWLFPPGIYCFVYFANCKVKNFFPYM